MKDLPSEIADFKGQAPKNPSEKDPEENSKKDPPPKKK